MCLFNRPHRSLRGVSLAVVERNRPDVAARSRLAYRDGASLTSHGSKDTEGILRTCCIVDPRRSGPIGQARGVRSNVVVLKRRTDCAGRDSAKKVLHVYGDLGEFAGGNHIWGSNKDWIASLPCSRSWTVAELISAWTIGAVLRTCCLGERIID